MIRTTLAQANHFVLQKNYLAAQKAPDLAGLVEDLAGLPAEPPTTPFLSTRARLVNFTPEQLSAQLSQQGGLIKSPLVRNVPYIITAHQFATWHAATARQRNQGFNAEFRLWGLESNDEIESLGQQILALLGNRPMSTEAVARQLPPEAVKELTQTSRGGRVSKTTNVALALRWLAAQGQLAVLNSASDWRAETPTYLPWLQHYPNIDLASTPGEADAQKAVVRAYLSAFGPATEADISFWTGFGKSETARATNALSSETILTMVKGIPGMLLSLKNQADTLKATNPPAEPVVNLLPANDPLTTAHRASRARYFADPSLQRRVFSSSGATKPTILVNGQIVGVWDWQLQAEQGDLTWQLFIPVNSATLPLIETQVEQVARFIHPNITIQQKTD